MSVTLKSQSDFLMSTELRAELEAVLGPKNPHNARSLINGYDVSTGLARPAGNDPRVSYIAEDESLQIVGIPFADKPLLRHVSSSYFIGFHRHGITLPGCLSDMCRPVSAETFKIDVHLLPYGILAVSDDLLHSIEWAERGSFAENVDACIKLVLQEDLSAHQKLSAIAKANDFIDGLIDAEVRSRDGLESYRTTRVSNKALFLKVTFVG
jgi:hypothetical protein